MRTSRWLPVLSLMTLLAGILPYRSVAQTLAPRTDIWTPNGSVEAVERIGSRILAGGHFTAWAPYSGGSATIAPETGQALAGFPLFNYLNAIIPARNGGWIAIDGARLTSQGDVPVRLLGIREDGSVSFSRRYRLNTMGGTTYIASLAQSGDTLYLGGSFVGIDGHRRRNAAAISMTTGELLSWQPEPNGRVSSMAFDDGLVYIAGSFDSVGSTPLRRLARVTSGAGSLVPWTKPVPSPLTSDDKREPERIVIVDGVLYTPNGAFTLATMEQTSWRPDPTLPESPGIPFHVSDIAVADGVIYTVGMFSRMNGGRRPGVAAFSVATGELLPWAPNQGWIHRKLVSDSPEIEKIAVIGDRIYLGGSFSDFDGAPAERFAAVDRTSGARVAWEVRSFPFRVAVSRSSKLILHGDSRALFVADGRYGSIGRPWLARNGFAEIDAATGDVTSWDPGFVSTTYNLSSSGGLPTTEPVVRINTFARNDSILYIGGLFDSVAGQSRTDLCAFDLRTRTLLPWAPRVGGYEVVKIAYSDGVLYVSGHFDTVDGMVRRHTVALDGSSGELLPWDPRLDTLASDIDVRDGRVYLAGQFRTVAGLPHAGLAIVDPITGSLIDEGPVLPSRAVVNTIELSDSLVYLSGSGLGPEVTPVSTGIRSDGPGFGGYDRRNGALRWTPQFAMPTGVAAADIHLENGRLVVSATRVVKLSSQSARIDSIINQIVTFDATTGALLAYGPCYDIRPNGLLVSGDTILSWGTFIAVDGTMMPSMAWLQPAPATVVRSGRAPVVDRRIGLYPNPAWATVSVSVPAGAGSTGRVIITDMRGNIVATMVLRDDRSAIISLEDLPSGSYMVKCGEWNGRLVVE
jgi:hypothetical protein